MTMRAIAEAVGWMFLLSALLLVAGLLVLAVFGRRGPPFSHDGPHGDVVRFPTERARRR